MEAGRAHVPALGLGSDEERVQGLDAELGEVSVPVPCLKLKIVKLEGRQTADLGKEVAEGMER